MLRISVILLCFCILYYKVFTEIGMRWFEDENYSHGIFIPFVVYYLIQRKWKDLVKLELRPNNLGFIVLFLGLALLICGHFGSELFLKGFSMNLVLMGLIMVNYGSKHLEMVFFPVIFLIFMIPMPYIIFDSISFELKMMASRIAALFLDFLYIPVLREGNIIHLSSTSLQIEEACSGMRSLISLLALGAIYSYIRLKGFFKRGILILCAGGIAVIMNAFRISVTGVLAALYGGEVAKGFFHNFSGLLIFLFSLPLVYLAGSLVERLPFDRNGR